MDFSLSEDQLALRALAADIFSGRATTARVEQVEATDDRFDRDLWRELASSGLLGIALPEDVGGAGLGMVELALVLEQQGRVVAPVPLLWTAVAAAAVAEHGTQSQRDRWLPGLTDGQAVLTVVPPVVAQHARLDGDRVSGVLPAVPWAHVSRALLLPVGDDLFLLDLAAREVSAVRNDATNHEVHLELTLDGAPVERLGRTGAGGWVTQRLLVGLAALQAGITDAALRMTADYVSNRQQFDKPLSTFQGVALKAADGYVDNAAIRATALQAAWRLDRAGRADAEVEVAAWWAAEAGQHCVHVTQHLHGGMGADVTYPVHRYYLWGKQIELLVGGASATLARLGDIVSSAHTPGDALYVDTTAAGAEALLTAGTA